MHKLFDYIIKKIPYTSTLVVSGVCFIAYLGANGKLFAAGTIGESEGETALSEAGFEAISDLPFADELADADGAEAGNGGAGSNEDGAEAGNGGTGSNEDGAEAGNGGAGSNEDGVQAGNDSADSSGKTGSSNTGASSKGSSTDNSTTSGKNSSGDSASTASTQKPVGVTRFVEYEPVKTDSRYYSDPGRYALTTEYDYEEADPSYFDDALFIGDSRMLGVNDYCGWNADFICDNGYCTYSFIKEKKVKNHTTGKKVLLEDALEPGKYGKVYIMLGLNDCGYGNTANFKERYQTMIDLVKEREPDAIIYLLAIIHLSEAKNDNKGVLNNVDINDKNVAIAECADGITTFYIDFNPYFTDERGFLEAEKTFDGIHLYAKHYMELCDVIRSCTVPVEKTGS